MLTVVRYLDIIPIQGWKLNDKLFIDDINSEGWKVYEKKNEYKVAKTFKPVNYKSQMVNWVVLLQLIKINH